jgi:predicted ABC-type ATPase
LVSAIADFLHEQLIESHISFSFETVMSHPRKIEVLEEALANGFRNYLYFVATEDPAINISRVQIRVREGGHDVPHEKIRSRYYRTLDSLIAAIRVTNRAYIYDNSGAQATLIAEITDGKDMEIRNSNVPVWFRKYVLEKGTHGFKDQRG